MVYERYPRGYQSDSDYGRDYGSGREYTYSSARDYAAAGRLGQNDQTRRSLWRNDGRNDDGRTGYGARGYGDQGSGRRDDYGPAQRLWLFADRPRFAIIAKASVGPSACATTTIAAITARATVAVPIMAAITVRATRAAIAT